MKILLIEDSESVRDDLAAVLRTAGHACDAASTVDAALLALASGSYDVALLDLALDRDPSSLHTALAARGTPTILVSGAEPARLPEIARSHGWAYLAKPFEPSSLLAILLRVLPRESTAPPPRSPTSSAAAIVVDLGALATLAAELLVVRPASVWVQGGCVAGILLLAGVRVADVITAARGLPTSGGPAAILLSLLTAAAQRQGPP